MILAGVDVPDDVGHEIERLTSTLVDRMRGTAEDRAALLLGLTRLYGLGYTDAAIDPHDLRMHNLRKFGPRG